MSCNSIINLFLCSMAEQCIQHFKILFILCKALKYQSILCYSHVVYYKITLLNARVDRFSPMAIVTQKRRRRREPENVHIWSCRKMRVHKLRILSRLVNNVYSAKQHISLRLILSVY